MKKGLNIFISWLCILLILLVVFWNIFKLVYDPLPPLKYAQIPQKTKDFFNKLFQKDDDVLSKYNNKQKPEDWKDENNPGEDKDKKLKKLEDANFIIYYTNEDWAKKTQKYANQAIKPLEQLMGKYYYPKDVNNRKLAIYLAKSEQQFSEFFTSLTGINQDVSWAAGFYIHEYSLFGNLSIGILINSNVWSTPKDWDKIVIWHEMNHYIFFSGLDFSKSPFVLKWASEGIAEYFSGSEKFRLNELNINKCSSYSLGKEFDDFRQNYPGGLAAYLSFNEKYNVSGIKKFLEYSKTEPTDIALTKSFSTDLKSIDNQWHNYMNNRRLFVKKS